MYESVIRPILFALSEDDAEKAHDLARQVLRVASHVPPLVHFVAWCYEANRNPKPVEVCGICFPNRVGLAAGFDKHAEMLPMIQALGFGFAEVGTVTPYRQAGQARPRIFRSLEDQGLINRMGFNSDGVLMVEKRLTRTQKKMRIPLGISPGKMKDTSLDHAAYDYSRVWSRLRRFGAYNVANISSPNTPGLRKLQGAEYLYQFVKMIVDQESQLAHYLEQKQKPIFIKLAPDLSEGELVESIEACERGGASGLVIGNTTLTRPVKNPASSFAKEPGGYSGPGLFPLTKVRVEQACATSKLPVIAVGGIDNSDKAQQMFDVGAKLVEIYTGFIYHGPELIQSIRALPY